MKSIFGSGRVDCSSGWTLAPRAMTSTLLTSSIRRYPAACSAGDQARMLLEGGGRTSPSRATAAVARPRVRAIAVVRAGLCMLTPIAPPIWACHAATGPRLGQAACRRTCEAFYCSDEIDRGLLRLLKPLDLSGVREPFGHASRRRFRDPLAADPGW